ncbi:MAG: hypothetical protein V3T80_06885 [Kiloniellales bacterium]
MARRKPHSDVHRRQRAKNWVLLLVLAAFVVVVYFVSLVRMGGG